MTAFRNDNSLPGLVVVMYNNVPKVVAGVVVWQLTEFMRSWLAKSTSTNHSKAFMKSLQGLPSIVQLIITATGMLPILIRTESMVEKLERKVDSLGRREEELAQAHEMLNDLTLQKLRNSAANALTEAHRILNNTREVADEESKK